MSTVSDVEKFLQAVFGSDYGTRAIFTNLNPAADTRNLAGLDAGRDCYIGPWAYPDDGKLERGARATEARCLVIDDVGTAVDLFTGEAISKVSFEQVALLGPYTAVTRTSPDNHQYWFKLDPPVPASEWPGFRAGVIKILGVTPDNLGVGQIFRLPMGRNTKRGYNVELVDLKEGTALKSATIPREAVKSKTPGEARKVHDIKRLVEWVSNDDLSYDEWIAKGQRIYALDPGEDGREAWHALSARSDKNNPEITETKWHTFTADVTRGGLLLAEAQAAGGEAFTRWEVKEVFNDGVEPPEITPGPKSAPHVLASGEFVEEFVPPDYLVKKLITKAFLYSLTGQTGAGKTSITLRLAATIALGRSFGGLGTKPFRVLYLAAENPIDIQMRWIALGAEMGFDVNTIGVFFVKGGFKLGATMRELRGEALRVDGEFGLVVVDTGPVFFEGEDENDRVAMRRHARIMRELIEVIPGKPTVIVNVHPTKNAGADNLLPSGGGSFLNEVDGNLTAAKGEDQTIELGWQGKWRGVEFAPLHFLLKTVTHPRLVDSDGEAMPTVVCEHLSSSAKEVMEQAEFVDQGKLLDAMERNPRISAVELAIHMNWYYPGGSPAKSKVQRYVKTLIKQRLVKKDRQSWIVAGAIKAKSNGSDRTGPDLIKTAGPKKH